MLVYIQDIPSGQQCSGTDGRNTKMRRYFPINSVDYLTYHLQRYKSINTTSIYYYNYLPVVRVGAPISTIIRIICRSVINAKHHFDTIPRAQIYHVIQPPLLILNIGVGSQSAFNGEHPA